MQLAKVIFDLTKLLPKKEMYGMTAQLRKCAVSIPSNIAEGSQRTTDADFGHFIAIARGSLAEAQTQMLLARDFDYISQQDAEHIEQRISELGKMLHAFHAKLNASR